MHIRVHFSLVVLALFTAVQACIAGTSTTVVLAVSPNPATFGTSVKLKATLLPPSATGKVAFYDGTVLLGSAKLASGTALFSTILLPAGKRKLKAHYNGDSIHDTSTSSAVLATVSAI